MSSNEKDKAGPSSPSSTEETPFMEYTDYVVNKDIKKFSKVGTNKAILKIVECLKNPECNVTEDTYVVCIDYKAPNGFYSDTQICVTGKVKIDESLVDASIREIEEETGIIVKNPIEFNPVNRLIDPEIYPDVYNGNFIVIDDFGGSVSQKDINIETQKRKDIKRNKVHTVIFMNEPMLSNIMESIYGFTQEKGILGIRLIKAGTLLKSYIQSIDDVAIKLNAIFIDEIIKEKTEIERIKRVVEDYLSDFHINRAPSFPVNVNRYTYYNWKSMWIDYLKNTRTVLHYLDVVNFPKTLKECLNSSRLLKLMPDLKTTDIDILLRDLERTIIQVNELREVYVRKDRQYNEENNLFKFLTGIN